MYKHINILCTMFTYICGTDKEIYIPMVKRLAPKSEHTVLESVLTPGP